MTCGNEGTIQKKKKKSKEKHALEHTLILRLVLLHAQEELEYDYVKIQKKFEIETDLQTRLCLHPCLLQV